MTTNKKPFVPHPLFPDMTEEDWDKVKKERETIEHRIRLMSFENMKVLANMTPTQKQVIMNAHESLEMADLPNSFVRSTQPLKDINPSMTANDLKIHFPNVFHSMEFDKEFKSKRMMHYLGWSAALAFFAVIIWSQS